ncbi:MAG: carbohydrate binding family 9 domain-containing protein [Acidobacteria bacterium]|nr:carbohydrate binding family 9 domain-containing protein [Acidobacteriota bacterium]
MTLFLLWLWCVNEPGMLVVEHTAQNIVLDGKVDPGEWEQARPIRSWFETNPGDNVEPKVKNTGYITYDDQFFYVALIMEDPDPNKIKAPLADRDQVPSFTDYAGIILDTANEGKVAQMFLANPRGIQYDAISGDASGEDSSPDFFWDVATEINATGWSLEMRIPFSSLRYAGGEAQTWRFMLYRNYPRDFRYQMFSNRLPRDRSCFICNSQPLTGLEGLPSGGHLVLAPYAFGSQAQNLDSAGSLQTDSADGEPGIDVKWTPNPGLALDLTVNPDFSQIESDTAQITTNERFAIFYPEKRPFFLEGSDLFSTPLRAVHTRSITDPKAGARATGKLGSTSFTALSVLDQGGGSVVIPGAEFSDFANQDFESTVTLARMRHDRDKGFVSFLASDRENDGGGYNRVYGPDFDFRPNDSDQIGGQVLFSQSQNPDRPDLYEGWNGQKLEDWAGQFWLWRGTSTWDYWLLGEKVGEDFRAENGFIPQVGYEKTYAEVGRTFRPKQRFMHRIRTFVFGEYTLDEGGNVLYRLGSVGAGMSGKKNSFFRFRLSQDGVRVNDVLYERDRFHFYGEWSPSRRFGYFSIDGVYGDEVDFSEGRLGTALSYSLNATIQPTDHWDIRLTGAERWLKIDKDQASGKLFTARVGRVRATYNFSSRLFARSISQYAGTTRNQALFSNEITPKSGNWSNSLLLAYKLNWQSVVFVGYGDLRDLDEQENWQTQNRNWFLKVSYAYQR